MVDLSVQVSVDFRAKCKNGTVNKKTRSINQLSFWSLLFTTSMVYNQRLILLFTVYNNHSLRQSVRSFWCWLLTTKNGLQPRVHFRVYCLQQSWSTTKGVFWCLLLTTNIYSLQQSVHFEVDCLQQKIIYRQGFILMFAVYNKHGLQPKVDSDVYCLQQTCSTTKGSFWSLLFTTNMVYNQRLILMFMVYNKS